jgi:hypothetical protein
MAITLPTSVGPVVLKEMFDDYEKGIGGQGPWIRKSYYINDYAKANAVANALLGITFSIGGINGTINRSAPHRCPESPNLWAMDVGPIRGFGAASINGGTPTYPGGATIGVTYGVSPVPFDGASGGVNTGDPYNLMTPDNAAYPFMRFDLDTGTETYSIPDAKFLWVDDVTPANRLQTALDLTASVGVSTIVCTIMQIPFLPFYRLITMKRMVNNANFMGFAAGYVLYENSRSSRTVNSDGTYSQDLVLTFKVREFPWGTYAHPSKNLTFVAISHNGLSTGNGVYTRGDLTPLLYGVSL